ncbi:MAG: Glycosyl transferase group 1 [Candidatus Peregrinibacteria bacterium GW2011_GWA2_33_10]|nr:MAG: Glycosyl transferase group 1 [Candidatus Peregrinibacteria bacterium GW2011_GWA2_33_10]KKP41116.1 MAG: group 1 glycosyl transferase [Candidatus Peregrinibacteria bacterium GW2011_GWC2_33_13]OGJ47543.1 MAG: hypothetical protein A2229_00995 [Candidatus Peregrinibacteria bacterium RIFOXYA2_FULL_33_7]
MKLFYIANVRLPTEKAHGIQIVRMCESFGKLGIDVSLIAPMRFKTKKLRFFNEDIYSFYKINKNFQLKKLFNMDFLLLDNYLPKILTGLPFLIQNSSFLVTCLIYSLCKKVDLIYTRSFLFTVLLNFFKKNSVILELHNLPFKKFSQIIFKKFIKRINKIVVINENIKNILISWGVDGNKILTGTSAIADSCLKVIKKDDARIKLNIAKNEKIIMYTGNLYAWKGVYTLADAALLAPEYVFYIVGGSDFDKEVQMFKIYLKNKKIKNINMVGYVKPSLIQYYLAAADILVAPNSAKSDASMNYTSPLKLYEYMASRRPIILSDLTSMRNLIDAKFVFWMKPDDPKSLIDKIKEVENNESIAKKKAQEAFSFVKTKTWDNRAEDILKYWNLI